MNMPITTIKARLKEGLEKRNLNQQELSEKTGIPKGSISHYVTGHVEPKNDRIYLIAQALNVSEAWLLGYDVPMQKKEEAISIAREGFAEFLKEVEIKDALQDVLSTDKDIGDYKYTDEEIDDILKYARYVKEK